MSGGPFRRWSLALVRWVGRAIREDGIEREALVRAAKTAGAVSLAWLVAGWVLRTPQSFAAPYAAVFVMRDTVYRSVASAVQQFFGLLTGLLLAYLAISVVHEPVAALGVAVFVAVLVGRWRRWGANGEWVAITALVMLTYGTAGEGGYLLARVWPSMIGAVIGIAVTVLVLPPVYLQSAHRAVRTLARDLSHLLGSLATGLREDWTDEDARSWSERAEALQDNAVWTQDAIGKGEESARLNLWRRIRSPHRRTPLPSAHRPVVAALAAVAQQCQRMGELLLADDERGAENGAAPPDLGFGVALAELLDDLAKAVAGYQDAPRSPGDVPERLRVELSWLGEQHHRLTEEIRAGQLGRPESWGTQGGLLLAADRAVRALLRGSNAPRSGLPT
jgi:uncharacterized membrane protein YccC